MAKQTINQGTAPTGAGGDTFRTGSAKLQANDDELYVALGASGGVLPAALPLTKGGTGATTAAAARTNLGLGDAATANLTTSATDSTAGRVLKVGDFGIGLSSYGRLFNIGTIPNSTEVYILLCKYTEGGARSHKSIFGEFLFQRGDQWSTNQYQRISLDMQISYTSNPYIELNQISGNFDRVDTVNIIEYNGIKYFALHRRASAEPSYRRCFYGVLGSIADDDLFLTVVNASNVTVISTPANLISATPISRGGTGAATAVEARTNLGLGTAATQNKSRAFLGVGAAAPLGANSYIDSSEDGQYVVGFNGGAEPTHPPVSSAGYFIPVNDSTGATGVRFRFAMIAGTGNNLWFQERANSAEAWTVWHKIYTTRNTSVDPNGFIKAASPIVKLFADKIELNDEAQLQEITFEKLGTGDYLIKGSSGFAQDGWYVEQPKDSNGNIYHAVVYDTLTNGDISVRTYEQKTDGVKIVADLDKPVDIKENRFISIRLQELPQEPIEEPQPDPTITDYQGNPAPSRLHELVDGTWTISSENAAILENERLAAMPALTRRQFRLALVLNGYNLADIETLINSIEDPMQRQITMIEWQDATTFHRTSPSLLAMADLMGLGAEQVNMLWNQALTL